MIGILGGLNTKSRLKVRDRTSGFLPIQGSSSAGYPNSFLVPLNNSHLWSFKRLYEIRDGPGNLHIIINGRSSKLSIPHLTPYEQSAERFKVQNSVRSVECRVQFEAAIGERQTFFFFGRKDPQSLEERQTF